MLYVNDVFRIFNILRKWYTLFKTLEIQTLIIRAIFILLSLDQQIRYGESSYLHSDERQNEAYTVYKCSKLGQHKSLSIELVIEHRITVV